VAMLLIPIYVALCIVSGGAVLAMTTRGELRVRLAGRVFLSFAVGAGLNWFVPSLLTGLLGLVWRFEMSRIFVVAVAVGQSAALYLAARFGKGTCPWAWLRTADGPEQEREWPLVVLLVGATLTYLLTFDSQQVYQNSCIMRDAVIPYHNYLSPDTPMGFTPPYMLERNGFLMWEGGQRLGPTFMVAPFFAWFEFMGMRLLHSLCGVCAAGFTYLAARRLLDSRPLAMLAAVAVAFNPQALTITVLDENTLALGPVAGALYFSLVRGHGGFLAGAMMGMALGTRHTLVLALPAMLVPYLAATRRKEVWGFLLGLLVFCAPWITRHYFMWVENGHLFESFANKPILHYNFLGMEFDVGAFLNWPFLDRLVRSPYTAYPPLIGYPLYILRAWGNLFVAAGIIGVLAAGALHGRLRVSLVLWIVPFMAMLMVQSSWVAMNKMGIWIVVSPAMALVAAAGIKAVVRRVSGRLQVKKGWAVTWVVAVICLGVFQTSFPPVTFPADYREFLLPSDVNLKFLPLQKDQDWITCKDYARSAEDQFTFPYPLPDPRLAFSVFSPSLLIYRLGQIARDMVHPGFAERPLSIHEPRDQVTAFRISQEWSSEVQRLRGVSDSGRPESAPGKADTRAEFEIPQPPPQAGVTYKDLGIDPRRWLEDLARREDGDGPQPKVVSLLQRATEAGIGVLPLRWFQPCPLDSIEGPGNKLRCERGPDFDGTSLRFDFSKLAVANPDFITVDSEQRGVKVFPGRAVVVLGIDAVKENKLPLDFIATVSPEGAVFVWFAEGTIVREYLAKLCWADVFDAAGSRNVTLEFPSGSPLFVREIASQEPRCLFGWNGYIGDRSLTLGKSFRTWF